MRLELSEAIAMCDRNEAGYYALAPKVGIKPLELRDAILAAGIRIRRPGEMAGHIRSLRNAERDAAIAAAVAAGQTYQEVADQYGGMFTHCIHRICKRHGVPMWKGRWLGSRIENHGMGPAYYHAEKRRRERNARVERTAGNDIGDLAGGSTAEQASAVAAGNRAHVEPTMRADGG